MEPMGLAKLVGVCPKVGTCNVNNPYLFKRRQLPLTADTSLTMVMELSDIKYDQCDHTKGKNRNKHAEIDSFIEKYSALSRDELAAAVMIPSKELFGHTMQESVPCVGCRRSMEQMFTRLRDQHHVRALEPLVITGHSELSLVTELLYDPRKMYNLFHLHGSKLEDLVNTLHKNKKNRRCVLHSLDNHKTKQISTWIDIWEVMEKPCREEVTLVQASSLHSTTEAYLRKHRFCGECKTKVMRAYSILVGEVQPCEEKGYCSALYEGIRCCPREKHVHLLCETDFIGRLIARAEPELNGIRRERHAKTIDIAQEEVLTCLGLHLYERLHKIWQNLRAEEQTFLLLFHVGVQKLEKALEMALEAKQGMSKLEQVCEEITEADRLKKEKRDQKKQRRKARKKNKNTAECGETEGEGPGYTLGQDPLEEPGEGQVEHQCQQEGSGEGKCLCDHDENDNTDILCKACDTHLQTPATEDQLHSLRNDPDYSSGIDCGEDCGHSSRESSEVACSEGLCNHDRGSIQGEDLQEDSCSQDLSQEQDEICLDSSLCHSNHRSSSQLPKCDGGKPLDCVHCGEEQEVTKEVDQVQKICQCSTEAQLRRAVGWTSTLQDMLEGSCSSDEEPVISQEEIRRFRDSHKSLDRQRKKLRAKIRHRYNKKFALQQSANHQGDGFTVQIQSIAREIGGVTVE
ncbi:gametogenetin-binding protein 2-like isoform X2 [Acanthaster planci]|nr:gametogenetin-binding protein 2-like isoform X2 [Acanthaster planci]